MGASDVSIIILNYNSSEFTLSCIRSIVEQTTALRYEIIVVDNGSLPAEYEALSPLNLYPSVKVVRNRVNVGFSAGNMTGVQFASVNTRYYYFLNNDCLLLNDVCEQLVYFMDKTPDAGICTAQMVSASLEPKLSFQYFPTAAVKLLGHGFVRFCRPGQYPPLRGAYTQPVKVPLVMGSSLFVRSCAFQQIGGFDTAYFLYCEEEDICKRLLMNGYGAYLVPQATYIHLGGKSTKRTLDVEKEYYISLFHYFYKYHAWPERLLLRSFYFVKNARKFYRNTNYLKLAFFILTGSPTRCSLRHKQTLWAN